MPPPHSKSQILVLGSLVLQKDIPLFWGLLSSAAINLPNSVNFKTVPHAVLTPNDKIILFLLHHCDFATVTNHKYPI